LIYLLKFNLIWQCIIRKRFPLLFIICVTNITSVSGETSFAYLIYKNIPKLGFRQFRQFRTYRKIYCAKCFGLWKIVSPETLRITIKLGKLLEVNIIISRNTYGGTKWIFFLSESGCGHLFLFNVRTANNIIIHVCQFIL
jgi:hypothetical protein